MEHHALVQEIIVLGLKNNTCVKRNGKARLKKRLCKSLDVRQTIKHILTCFISVV